ncbi:3-isopropylmalate dehydrogenase [Boletus reticuloceps]|uniref:3-isopropylmalate dehydrogenase n=1 Tax=Boletus reticuloceps TaxID=495285 RepID=A0A8I2YSZ7_9AGAM|nr:3-isopropylmalate dehydrogenase [Boletus reticuloceps]
MALKQYRIVVLPGDGIGPSVVAQAIRVLELISETSSTTKLILEPHDFGGCAIDKHGDPLPPSTLKACQEADAILMGSVGGPKWGPEAKVRPEQGLLRIRKELAGDCQGVDMIVIRELIGGLYFGPRQEQGDGDTAYDTMVYSVSEVQRITRVAAQIALAANPPLAIHSIDKANVLASSRLWRKVVTETLKNEYPQLTVDHYLVDTAAMLIVSNPKKLNGVILTENMFGDILSDETSVIPGSLGLLPSASLAGAPASPADPSFKPTTGIYEPIHGSAPDIAGKGIANPVGTILSAAMLLRYSLGLEKEAQAVEAAVSKSLDDESIGGYGARTADLGGKATTVELGDRVIETLKQLL